MTSFTTKNSTERSRVSARAITCKLRLNGARKRAATETTSAFLERVSRQARSHRAVHHPYLRALASGGLPDTRRALKDFARHYHGYSAYFPHYLRCAIGQLSVPEHREALTENLTEESGQYPAEDLAALRRAGISPEWIVGVPHPELFRRFGDALGVEHVDVEGDATAMEVICWREMLLGVLAEGSPAQSVGALGLGTEGVVSTMYRYFLPALERLGLDPKDTVFFPLHTMVDDHHQATLLDIAGHYAGTAAGRHELVKGMNKALYLRAGFWDWLHVRAREPRRTRVA
jgi:pyrroloquinoline quinone (PQQ) biosynthesis protein C